MTEQRSYRSESERAVRASILGAILGLLLALFVWGRRDQLAREEAPNSGGHSTGDA